MIQARAHRRFCPFIRGPNGRLANRAVCHIPHSFRIGQDGLRLRPPRPQKPKQIFLYKGIPIALDKLRNIVTRFASRAAYGGGQHGAFYAMSPRRIQSSLSLWKSQLPIVQPFYAVKCNPEPLLLNTLYDSGASFDCASERELLDIQKLARGTLASHVIYANPCKSARDLAAAREMGAPTTVVDSVEELDKLSSYEGGALVRVAVDDTSSAMPFSTKFGCRPEDIPLIAAAARGAGVQLHGVSFHVGSGCTDGEAYSKAIQRAYTGILELRRGGHKDARILDIGGGYLCDEGDFRKKAIYIRGAISDVEAAEKESRDRGPKLGWIAEPGRFFATNAFDLFVQVIGKKPAVGGTTQPAGWKYTLDDSLYGQFSGILFDYATPSWVRVRMGERERERKRSAGVLFGRTCDSVDVIARAESMEELEVGDWLWFPSMGAYSRATASEFNGFPTPPVVSAEDLPAPNIDAGDFFYAAPRGVTRMPPVSARAFWSAGPPLKN